MNSDLPGSNLEMLGSYKQKLQIQEQKNTTSFVPIVGTFGFI